MSERLEIVISATDQVSPVLSKLKSGLGGLGGLAKGALVGGLGLAATGATAAMSGLAAGLGVAIEEAIGAEEVLAQLDAVLESTGGAAGVTKEMATDLADSLSKVTKFSDDAVLEGQNMLLTFTNIGKDVFPAVTETMLDMSQALGQDLQSSALQLGKALQDPVAGATALKRVGVNVTDSMIGMLKSIMGNPEELKKLGAAAAKAKDSLEPLNNKLEVARVKLSEMEASGKSSESQLMAQRNKISELETAYSKAQTSISAYDQAVQAQNSGLSQNERLLQAQNFLLKELQVEFGGSAKAAAETFGGQMEVLKNTLSNVAEEAGTVLLPILTDGLKSLAPILIDAAEGFASFVSSDEFKTWLKDLGDFLVNQVIPAISALANFLMTTLVPAVAEVIKWIGETLLPILKQVWAFLAENLGPVFLDIATFFTKTIPEALAALRDAWESDFGGIRTMFEGVWNHIKLVFSAFQAAFSGDWYKFGQIIRQIVDNSWNVIKTVFSKWIGVVFNTVKNLFSNIKNIDWKEVGKNIVMGIADGIKGAVSFATNAIIEVGQAILSAIKGFLGIQSPSSVMAKQVGLNMVEGIKVGLAGGLRNLSADISTNFSPVVSGFSTGRSPSLAAAGGSGHVVNVNYYSAISFADEYEAEHRLMPILDRALRKRHIR